MPKISQILEALGEPENIEIKLCYKSEIPKKRHSIKLNKIGVKILEIVLKLLPKLPSMKDIADKFNSSLKSYELKLTPRKVGYIVRNELKLQPERTSKGYVIKSVGVPKLKALGKKYGFNINVIAE